jgi:tRNA (cytidine/uridine-2'-O-)-methyltransferase
VVYQPLLHVVLHQPEIPQNTGNIGRTCVAVGAKLWLVQPFGFRLDESRLRRAGLDYWEHLQWESIDEWATLRERLKNHRFWYFSKSARREYCDAALERGDVLVFGSETQGLPPSLLADAGEQALRIPMRPPVRSLNLASAVAVAIYEAHRQIAALQG